MICMKQPFLVLIKKIIYLQIVKSSSIKHLDFIGHISHDYMTMIYSKKENPYLRRIMP